MTTVGVLALQGDFREHSVSLRRVGANPLEVRTTAELARCDALILPGGESTTIARLLLAFELFDPIRELGRAGFPIWGTCAGAILLADEVHGELDRPSLGLLPITIDRNAYGRQVDSFETDLDAGALTPSEPAFHAIFIRAPRIRALRDGVRVVMRHGAELDHEPVAVRHGALLATTFHPELTDDSRLHRYFVEQCAPRREAPAPARSPAAAPALTEGGWA